MTCLEIITKAQKGLEDTDAFAVGEQLKELCEDPACAELVAKDLEIKGMNLTDCAAKIKAYADAHRKKGANFSMCRQRRQRGSSGSSMAFRLQERGPLSSRSPPQRRTS